LAQGSRSSHPAFLTLRVSHSALCINLPATMKSCVLLLSLLVRQVVPTLATFARVDQWHVQIYSAAGCAAADKVEDDYKELGVCDQDDATTWKKAVGTATSYTETKYSDNACTTVKAGETPYTLNAACTAKDGKWQTGSVSSTLDTYRGDGPYTDSACTTRVSGEEYGFSYHAMNTCQQTDAATSIMYVCTANTIQKGKYTTKDCSGTRTTTSPGCTDCFVLTSGDVCTQFPAGHEHAGKYYKKNCGPITAPSPAASASGGGRICSHGLTQLLLAAASAAVMIMLGSSS